MDLSSVFAYRYSNTYIYRAAANNYTRIYIKYKVYMLVTYTYNDTDILHIYTYIHMHIYMH